MDLTIEQLVIRQAKFQTQLDSFITFVNSLTESDIDETNIETVKSKLTRIIENSKNFDDIQSCIEDKGYEVDRQIIFRVDIEDRLDRATSKANRLINSFYRNSENTRKVLDYRAKNNIQLPTIHLPTFEGDFTKWKAFEDSFLALIHENDDLSDVQKLFYLKSSLKGEALSLVQALDTIHENYSVALNIIRNRYGHWRKIIYSHAEAIIEVKFTNLRAFCTSIEQHIQCLKSMKLPIDSWNGILVPLILSKLDIRTRREWETHLNNISTKETLPSHETLLKFLLERADIVDMSKDLQKGHNKTKVNMLTSTNKLNCPLCSGLHKIYMCPDLIKQEIFDRQKTIRNLKLCLNCLKPGHFSRECKGMKCKQCALPHNSILHYSLPKQKGVENTDQLTTHCLTKINSQVFLPTAEIFIIAGDGRKLKARALLDSGSQSHFITKSFFNKLGIKPHLTHTSITGINQGRNHVKSCATINMTSKFENKLIPLSVLIIPQITTDLPQTSCNIDQVNIPNFVQLADNKFNTSSQIDILVGAEVFLHLLKPEQIQNHGSGLLLQNTRLGWIVSGQLPIKPMQISPKGNMCMSLQENIEKFWAIEEFKNIKKHLSLEEQMCENSFVSTTSRDKVSGRFLVKIPLKNNYFSLGNSKDLAIKRFFALERRLEKDIKLKQMYTEFIHEYLSLGHMEICDTVNDLIEFYLPHHHVIKEDSLTTKLRVVFDGSAKSSTGVSLNDIQAVGATVQSDLFTILVNFRRHRFVVIADIEKMYRQILIHPEHRPLQKIVWRDHPSEEIKFFKLKTVTYGTASAPFLSTRCLYQLAIENQHKFPTESKIIKKDIYIDDLLSGSDSEESLKEICKNITYILESAGFHLRKWKSNSSSLFSQNSQSHTDKYEIDSKTTKTLGVTYDPITDCFQYTFQKFVTPSKYTKRDILSKTAQIFDPIGLLAPVTIVPKLIVQSLWREGISWDTNIPSYLKTRWDEYQSHLSFVSDIQIPRCIIKPNSNRFELHGFSDASEVAYGACIYVKSQLNNGDSFISLLTSKSRVAPLKQHTLPRLELCAAVLLAQLMTRVKEILEINIHSECYWSDSRIVLAWINSSSHKWQTFVANRIAEIQRLTDVCKWQHVNSQNNPADLITRGMTPDELKNRTIWWKGPSFLSEDIVIQQFDGSQGDLPESKKIINLSVNIDENDLYAIFNSFSRLSKLVNTFSYVLRFIKNCKEKIKDSAPLSQKERSDALIMLIKLAQRQHYSQEIQSLLHNKQLQRRSSILKLNPFLDNNKLIRVGGRIKHAKLSFNKTHPIILPRNHPLTILIARNEHLLNLHCGPNQLLFILRQTYWPIAGNALTRKIVRECIICFKSNPKPYQQFMGNLPEARLIPSPPFTHCGIDFAGPFYSRDRRSRGYKKFKIYICLFICMSTKAIHLESVSDLTTEAFLASLRRFISRRGKPLVIYSDNGTNFVGAERELKRLCEIIKNNDSGFCELMATNNIEIVWKFIPPRSPHHGGLWESHVKIVKRHLTKVIGESILTFEEFSTVLTQVEAVVNSRPLSALSNDPHDYTPLTPAHFLIGRCLVTTPDENYSEIPDNRLSEFQRLQRICQHFWKRWQREYVQHLQNRNKWTRPNAKQLQEGMLVLMVEENSPPGQWALGRIEKLWPGQDGLIRVVSVRNQTGLFKRAVNKICVLPITDND